IHYWSGIEEALQKLGAKVVVTKVPRTGCIRARAQVLHQILETNLSGSNVNLLAHSMGGLDCRYLITHIPTEKSIVRTLTTIATPHHGSPFMDWSFLVYLPFHKQHILFCIPLLEPLIQAFDTPAYSNPTTDYCVNYFNKSIPNNPSVAYYSYDSSTNVPIWSPLYFPYQIIKEKEGPNDGLVSVKSAQWGKYMGTVECDHWDLTN
ncbi:Alpha/Beta hydrolase protein, partial [Gigaspora rosea]